ncbi:hypothetical protein DNTS_007786 [Danionella cerebrum]|uniref:Uncharacterized protein n=1 Tax=Danionella cerebrum TaxID=2873325 RepID=A0A553RCU5_9TELE|nr:hypothetical protein DNTS_007786 [Danionella translucida]
MTRSAAFKVAIIFFIVITLVLPEFFTKISQIEFLCKPFEPCLAENEKQICGSSGSPCDTKTVNGSNKQRQEGWSICITDMDLRLLKNTSKSGKHVRIILNLNSSRFNYSVFVFLNNTDLYTEVQSDQKLFYCNLPPDKSKCPLLNTTADENSRPSQTNTSIIQNVTSLKSLEPTKPTNEKKTFKETAIEHGIECQPTSSSFLFYYQKPHNTTTGPAQLQDTHDDTVWLVLVLTVALVTILTVIIQIVKSCQHYHRASQTDGLVSFAVSGQRFKTSRIQKGNLTCSVAEVSIAMSSIDGKHV